MRKTLAALGLLVLALAGVFLLYSSQGGRTSPAADLERAAGPGSAGTAGERPVGPGAGAPSAAHGGDSPAAREAVAADEQERYGDWGEGAPRWVDGRVRMPAGVPADPTLRVIGLERSLAPSRLFGADGLVRRLADRTHAEPPPDVVAVAAVQADGSFRLPFPAGAETGWLALDGRFLYSPECTEVALGDDPVACVVSPKVGACIAGRVVLPADAADVSTARVELAPDPTQFSLVDVDTSWLFERDADVAADGGFEIRAVDASRPYELAVAHDELASWTRDGIVLEEGRVLEITAVLAHGATLRGRVVDRNGNGVAGAEVAAVRLVMWGFPGDELTRTESGADGGFELARVPPGRTNVLARRTGYLQSMVLQLELAEEAEQDGVELVLEEGFAVGGSVRWPDGEPARGVAVSVAFDPEAMMGMSAVNAARGADGSAETDDAGRFRVKGLGNGPFLVTASAPAPGAGEERGEAHEWTARVNGVAPRTEGLELVLARPSEVRGRVVDSLGEPVADFTVIANSKGAVFFMPGEHRKEEFHDAGGEFALSDLVEGLWELEVRAAGYGPSAGVELMLPREDPEPLEIVLLPSAGVAGKVVGPDGEPVPGAKVTLAVDTSKTFAKMTGRLELPETYCDDGGAFVLRDVAAGKRSLVAQHPGFAAGPPVEVEVEAGRVIEDVLLTLRLGGTLSGEVYDKEGERIAGAQVFVQDPATWETQSVRTDADGLFLVERLPPGKWQVTAMIGAIQPTTESGDSGMSAFFENMRFTIVDVREGETTHVTLGAPAGNPVTVHGTISHAGKPVKEATISFFPEGGKGMEAVKIDQVDGEGRYEVKVDEAGLFRVQVQFFGGVGVQQQNIEYYEEVPEGESHELDLDLPVGRITGVVRGPDREALKSVRVTLHTEGGASTGTFLGGHYAELETDASGRYAFDFLRPGTYSVAAGGAAFGGVFGTHGAYGRVVRTGVEVGDGEEVDGVDFELEPAGDITGVVRDAVGDAVSGAAIFVRDAEGRLLEPFTMIASGSDGVFRYSGVAPGEYTVSARLGGMVSAREEPVRVRAGKTAKVECVVDAGTMLLVNVIDERGEDVDATVSVVDERGRELAGMVSFSEVMTSLGDLRRDEVRVGPLPPGRYVVTAVARDGRRGRKPVSLDGRVERKLKVRLR